MAHEIFSRRFPIHKLCGLFYILVLLRQIFLGIKNRNISYDEIWVSSLVLQLSGTLQSITAVYTFYFLPKSNKEEGFFTDERTISKAFMKENIYFTLISAFAAAYSSLPGRAYIRMFPVIETVFVFFPYQTIRRIFPKTSFKRKEPTRLKQKNTYFHYISKHIATYYMLFAKHYMGNLLNYLFYMGLDTAKIRKNMFWVLIGGSYSLTFGIFLHTLKFRKVIGPKTAITAYFFGYIIAGIPAISILSQVNTLYLWGLATIGLFINLKRNYKLSLMYQIFVATILYLRKTNRSSISFY